MLIRNISDLKVRGGAAIQHGHHVVSLFGNMYYLPLIWLGLSCQMLEILSLMCSSLWNITSVLELHFHWILGNFVIHEHVIYHVYHRHYVMFSGNFKS